MFFNIIKSLINSKDREPDPGGQLVTDPPNPVLPVDPEPQPTTV